MTKNGIVHLAFHPCTDSLILAAADKSGHVGLWSVDNEAQPASASVSKENQAQDPAQQDTNQPGISSNMQLNLGWFGSTKASHSEQRTPSTRSCPARHQPARYGPQHVTVPLVSVSNLQGFAILQLQPPLCLSSVPFYQSTNVYGAKRHL